jgi:hypothetical protein
LKQAREASERRGVLKESAKDNAAAADWLENYGFTSEQKADIEEMTARFRQGIPWLDSPRQEARLVAARAGFPRSKAGKYQDNPLARLIYFACQEQPKFDYSAVTKAAENLIVSSRTAALDSLSPDIRNAPPGTLPFYLLEFSKCLDQGEPFQPKEPAEFFEAIAIRLRYLETFKPADSDFAIQALQEAFVGLMGSKYDWSKERLPTKGEVRAIAKRLLERKNITAKSGWTEHLRKAGLDWLPAGRAGRRPTKTEVDKVAAEKKSALTKITKFVNKVCGGDWGSLNATLGKAFGKNAAMEAEQERLEQYTKPPSLDEKDVK